MPAMIDAQCKKCGWRFGWCGTVSNMPPCPKCGFRAPQAELDAAAAQMQAIRDRTNTHPKDATVEMRRQQRIDAGLTLRQAAKLLGVAAADLSAVENGSEEPTAELLELMAKTYGVGP